VGRKELQDAADALVRTGLFAKVNFKYDTHNDNLVVTFHIEESPRLPVSYDNFPWYSDSELDEALRKELPFYDGHLPEAGQVVERAAAVLKAFVTARDPNVEITHQVVLSPLSDGSEQQFTVQGPVPKIAKLEFGDPKLTEDLAVKAHIAEIVSRPYSRMTINVSWRNRSGRFTSSRDSCRQKSGRRKCGCRETRASRNWRSRFRYMCRACRERFTDGRAWSGRGTRWFRQSR